MYELAYIEDSHLPESRFACIHCNLLFITIPSWVQIAFHIAVVRTGRMMKDVHIFPFGPFPMIKNER